MHPTIPIDWLRLSRSPGIGATTLAYLVRQLGSVTAVLTASQKVLAALPNIRPMTCNTLAHFRQRIPAPPIQRELERLQAMGGQMVMLGEADYPPLLAAIHDPPPVLFLLGDPKHLQGEAPITVIGSRKATPSGLAFATQLGHDLAQCGLITISGCANGIDTAAHQGALAGGGPTVAVLATGLDVDYPRNNRKLKEQIQANGCLVSEAPLGLLPVPWLFPLRSRILSGLAKGVVIVEAQARSGTLLTARMALEQGREVFAVPGQAHAPNSQGTHELLRQGARLTEGVEDIIAELNWPIRMPSDHQMQQKTILDQHPSITGDSASVLACIAFDPIHEDELSRRCQLTVIALSSILLQLELSGLIKRLPGGRYTLSANSSQTG